MPALYAHNKFGKLVIPKLPSTIKETVRKYPNEFRMGLQGPDFLFFYLTRKDITKIGVTMHHSDVYPFMEHAAEIIKELGITSPEYSYMLGFICHFTLDNACHPYINKFMKETGCGHVEIEGDLEHLLITKDSFNPESYPIYKLAPATYKVAIAMDSLYHYVSLEDIYHSLHMMKKVKKIFVAPNCLKRSLLDLSMHATFHYKQLKGHVIFPNVNMQCRKESEILCNILYNSVDDAVNLINDFTISTLSGSILPTEFLRDFNGNHFSF